MKLSKIIGFFTALLPAVAFANSDSILTVDSQYSAKETVDRIQQVVQQKGMTVFAVIDHQQAAKNVDLSMPASTVVIFGTPKVGTPLMIEYPTLALDLPLKALVWEDKQGKVFVSLNKSAFLGERHQIPAEIVQKLAGAEKLIPATVK